MSTINNLNENTDIADGDLFVVWSTANGVSRKISYSNLLTSFREDVTDPDFTKTNLVPTTGFTHNFADTSADQWLIAKPAGTLATGTVNLPVSTAVVDGQRIRVTSSEIITSLTVNGNGATINGAPTTIAADGYFNLEYDSTSGEWFRVG